jgi:UDP-N-acetylmuramoyl-L-alanyl-D-glutamate--2,6-diaminopimelate ligase
MLLKDLVDELPALRTEGSLDREVAGITYDSRRISPGMVFVAIPGQNTDGHDFIPAAIDRGAAAIICERNGFTSQRAAKIKVADARAALARASAAFYGHPSAKLKVIGVTGTNGKTTVSFMVKRILEAAGLKTGLLGTIRYEIGDRVIPAHRTTPEALEVQYLMSQMLRAGCQACVMEVSSHALDQKRVAGVEFDVGIFTNLTQDHLDYHGTMENYFTSKSHLFDRWPDGSKPGAAIINIDDAYGLHLSDTTNAEVRLTYGVCGRASLRATKIQLGRDETRFQVETGDKTIACHLPLIGTHNIYNALAAAGTGLALKVSAQHIQAGLNGMRPVPGRLEGINCGQPFGVFVDYAHTDDALQNVLKTLREITPGRLLVTFGCGGSRDTGKRAKMGIVAARMADATIITSDNPRKETPASIAAQIEEGFRSVRTDGYRVELDRERSIDEVIRMAKPGDTVLIAGKGHETYQEFADTVVPFDDCVMAREALEAFGYGKGRMGNHK